MYIINGNALRGHSSESDLYRMVTMNIVSSFLYEYT